MSELEESILELIGETCWEGFGLRVCDLDEKEEKWLVGEVLANLEKIVIKLVDDEKGTMK